MSETNSGGLNDPQRNNVGSVGAGGVNSGGGGGGGWNGGIGGGTIGNAGKKQNFTSAYPAGSVIGAPGTTYKFGWQPYNDGTLQNSPDVWEAFNNPDRINYTDTPRTPGGSLSGTISGGIGPAGAGGSNSGQGGLGAGRRDGLVRALGGGGITSMAWHGRGY